MRKRALCLLAALLLCLALPLPAAANSAEPPRLSVLVVDPPEDLALSLVFSWGDEQEPVSAEAYRLGWEGYYLFRPWGFPEAWDQDAPGLKVELLAQTGGESFSLPVDVEALRQGTGSYYNNLSVLDLAAQTLTPGAPWWRQPVLVCLRVGLTLVLEGLVFLLFGYRQKRSWLVFLLVNLVTQLGVNLLLLGNLGPLGNLYGTWITFWFLYLPMELGVLLIEVIAFRVLLREGTKGRAMAFAACANLCSWALGGALLTYLPI